MRNAVAIFLLCIGFFGCSFEKPEVAETTNEKMDTNVESGAEETEEVSLINFDKETFDRERTAWEAQNRNSYRYQITSISDPPVAPVRITVLPDVEPLIEYVSDHALLLGDDAGEVVRRHGNTITGLYAAMEADITRLQNEAERIREKEEIKISIIYNETYHYPEYFISAIYYNGEQSTGGAYGFRINSFEVLTEPHS
ncbi:MAG: DUF6174 domain-containing protein [Treponema sp.]|jgi:hypothetical protein|nr:DUF6174 domain-containing protein [Treponema sp.]